MHRKQSDKKTIIMLAIVIPYFKKTYFEETLQSLSNQTDKRFKVYIGDDASPENCSDLLNKFQGKFNFEYTRFENNLGGTSLTQQWDRCIALTENEEWIMILGDDDFLSNTVVASFYQKQHEFFGKTNVIRYATKKVFNDKIEENQQILQPVWEIATEAFYRKFNKTTRSSLSEYIFSRKTYLKFGFYNYPLAWNSDDRAWLDFSDGMPIFSINESFVYFRLSYINISGRLDNLQLKNKSEIEFYKFVVFEKLRYYNKEQKLRLLRRYQAEIRVYKSLSMTDFFTLLYFYIKYLNVDWIMKFIKKITKKIFRNKYIK